VRDSIQKEKPISSRHANKMKGGYVRVELGSQRDYPTLPLNGRNILGGVKNDFLDNLGKKRKIFSTGYKKGRRALFALRMRRIVERPHTVLRFVRGPKKCRQNFLTR